MQKTKLKIILLTILFLSVLFIFTGLGCKSERCKQEEKEEIVLRYWRVFDNSDVFEPFISEYEKANKNIKIEYKKLSYDEYEKTVTDELAAGNGPDIWSIHNDWLPRHKDKLAPMPKPEQDQPFISPYEYKNTFPDVAYDDFVVTSKKEPSKSGEKGEEVTEIYGIPLSIDTMALYYNKTLFNNKKIPNPPSTWTELKEDVIKLTELDGYGNFIKSGAAIGTAQNVNRSIDILALLMMQNGVDLSSKDENDKSYGSQYENMDSEEGIQALQFYTDFANKEKSVYTWNKNMHYSIDAFAQGDTAMMFNYSYHISTIKEAKGRNIDFATAPMPQIKGTEKIVNIANYWAEVVTKPQNPSDPKQEMKMKEAWKFLLFLSQKENIKKYSEETGKPISRRDLIEEQKNNQDLRPFAEQILTAKTWQKTDPSLTETIFADMIESVVTGQRTPESAINWGNARLEDLMKKSTPITTNNTK